MEQISPCTSYLKIQGKVPIVWLKKKKITDAAISQSRSILQLKCEFMVFRNADEAMLWVPACLPLTILLTSHGFDDSSWLPFQVRATVLCWACPSPLGWDPGSAHVSSWKPLYEHLTLHLYWLGNIPPPIIPVSLYWLTLYSRPHRTPLFLNSGCGMHQSSASVCVCLSLPGLLQGMWLLGRSNPRPRDSCLHFPGGKHPLPHPSQPSKMHVKIRSLLSFHFYPCCALWGVFTKQMNMNFKACNV